MRAPSASGSDDGLVADSFCKLQRLVCRHSEAVTELAAELMSAQADIVKAAALCGPLAPVTGAGGTTDERLRQASNASYSESRQASKDSVRTAAWSSGGERFNDIAGAVKANAAAKRAAAPAPINVCSNDIGRFNHVMGAMTSKVHHPAIPDDATSCEDIADASPTATGDKMLKFSTDSKLSTPSSQHKKVNWDKVRAAVHERLKKDATEITKAQSGRIFADAEALKEAIRGTLTEEQFDLTSFYHRTGFSQAVVRTYAFEVGSLAMVCLSSLWMGVEIEFDKSIGLLDAHPVFQVMAQVFCVFFVSELLVRFSAFRDKLDVRRDPWFVFDALLVVLVVFETWVMNIVVALLDIEGGATVSLRFVAIVFRTLRVLRVLRLARVLRELPEFMVIIRGIVIALRGISIIIGLLTFVVYLGAIVFCVLLDDTGVGREYFRSIPAAMGTLLLEMTLSGGRGTHIIRQAHDEHLMYALLLLVFVVFSNITVMGVLSAVLVQTVRVVAEIEKEEKIVKSVQKTLNNLWDAVATHDRNKDGVISMKEFQALLLDRDVAQVLLCMDVDLEGLGDVAHFVFEEHNGALAKGQFKRMVLDLRNKQASKVKDHVETRKFISSHLKKTALLQHE